MNPVHGVLDLFGFGAGRGQHDQGLGIQFPAEPEELIRSKAVVIRVATPHHVGMVPARNVRADAVLPLIGGSEGALGPSDERRRQIPQCLQQVGAQHAVAADVRAHHRDEIEEQCSAARRRDLYRGLRVPHGAGEGKADFLPARAVERERRRCDRLALGAHNAKRQLRGAVLASDPERAVVLVPRIDVQPPLPDPGVATPDVEAHALLSVVEFDVRDLNPAAVRERLPIGLEVFALEPAAANLFCEQTVDHRMVDVLEEMAVDALVDRSRDTVRIGEQDGDSRRARCRSSARNTRARQDYGKRSGRDRTQEKAASIHLRFPFCIQR